MFLKLELIPGKCLGDFILGMTISEALNIIKHQNATIGKVEIIFNDSDPLSVDIVLKLVDDGVLLRFAPSSQRLRIIEIFDVSKLSLNYRSSTFSSSDNIASFVNIYSKFGPSYPGDFNAKKNLYHLHYPGLSFSFPIPSKFSSLYSESTELPVELPDGTTPIVSKIFIYSGLQMKTPLTQIPAPQPQIDDLIVCPNQGVYFTKKNCILTFSSTTQDVLSELGPPSKIYHKEEDNMKIHTYQIEGTTCPDYFYNYFHLGIDILFDCKKHTVKKFIFHTNFPTHFEFNLYSKCLFRIVQNGTPSKVIFEALKNLAEGKVQLPPKPEQQPNANNNNNEQPPQQQQQQPPAANVPLLASPANNNNNNNNMQLDIPRLESIIEPTLQTVHPDMKWDDVQNIFGKSGKPVVNNRGSVSNPFGSTYFYGYPGIIFETMRNNYIASVCLFNDTPIYVNNNINHHYHNNGSMMGSANNSYIDSIENGF